MDEDATTAKDNPRVKLRGTANWPYWSECMRVIAYKHKAQKILTGEEKSPVAPDASSTASERSLYETKLEKYEDRNRLMFVALHTGLNEETAVHANGVEMGDTATLWNTLCDFYESKTRASVKQNLSQLFRTKQAGTPIQIFAGIVDKLGAKIRSALR